MSDIIWPWAYGGSSIDRENIRRGKLPPALPPTARWWGNQARVSKGEPVRIIDFLELDRLQFWARCQGYQIAQGRTPSGLYFDPQVIDDFADTFGPAFDPVMQNIQPKAWQLMCIWSQSFVRVLHDYTKDDTEIEVKWELPWSENMPYADNWYDTTWRGTYQAYRPFIYTVHEDYFNVVGGVPWRPQYYSESEPACVYGLTQRGEVVKIVKFDSTEEANISVTSSTQTVPTHQATLKIIRQAAQGALAGDILEDEVINFIAFEGPWTGRLRRNVPNLMLPVFVNQPWKGQYFYGCTPKPFVSETYDYAPDNSTLDIYAKLLTSTGYYGWFGVPFSGHSNQPITMANHDNYSPADHGSQAVIDAGLYICGKSMIPVTGYAEGAGPQFFYPLPTDAQRLNDFVLKQGFGIPAFPDEGTAQYYTGPNDWPKSPYAPQRQMDFQYGILTMGYGFPYAEKLNTLRAFCELLGEFCRITEGPEHHTWVWNNPTDHSQGGDWSPPLRNQSTNPKSWTCESLQVPSFLNIYQPEAVGGRRY